METDSSEQYRRGTGEQEDGEGCGNLRRCDEQDMPQDTGRQDPQGI